MIKTEILLDSINESNGSRLTTWILEYPRFVHAEFMTHRMFSKNAASSRAIPIEKMIQQIIDNPAMPIWWGKNQSGMQANEELDGVKLGYVKTRWLEARDKAIDYARELNEIGLHKQITNRILEPWFNIRIVMSATEIQNFFALRAHKDAQPEIRVLAEQMLELYNNSQPQILKPGEWHIPFGDKLDEAQLTSINLSNYDIESHDWWKGMNEIKRKIAIARCARVSYFNYEGKDDYQADIKLCDRLFGAIPRHLSPTEHVAQATDNNNFIANFKGFKQYRYFFNDQNLKDERVIQKI